MSAINEADIHSFVDAISIYFQQITREKAEIRAAYLVEGDILPTTFELTGYITVTGSFSGKVYFSASRGMVSHLLLMMHDTDHSEPRLLDAVGEIANTISGNARKHFGESMEISVPTTQTTGHGWLDKVVSPHSYVVLIKWKQYRASVVVDIQSNI
ncbi:MAG: chemotaxis protein CheX [Zoogloeaceae bacterium]|jgi:chemotaxis protein CheX|nr:chemotaxis protein CheX [Zoogloeaceae bacterium]